MGWSMSKYSCLVLKREKNLPDIHVSTAVTKPVITSLNEKFISKSQLPCVVKVRYMFNYFALQL